MGIDAITASIILAEHRYRPIRGTIVTIGRQSIDLTGSQMDKLLSTMNVPKRSGATYHLDDQTVGVAGGRGAISQESFFSAFTDAHVQSIDVSAYEQADIICDIQEHLPKRYHGHADFVFNGSCLDNIFDPASSIKNISRMLKPRGRVYHFEQGNSHPTAYLKYSADWFMDYFAINNYSDCKVSICDKPNSIGLPLIAKEPPLDLNINVRSHSSYAAILYNFNPYVEHSHGVGYDCSSIEAFSRYEIHCIAEKAANSTDHRNPIQKHYRVDREQIDTCTASARRFLHSPRPLFNNGISFSVASIPRIDSSDYPQQITPIAVFPYGFLV